VRCVLCGCLFTACGQKGPPLAPLVHLPASVGELIVKRLGGDVVLQFRIPAANSDGTNPADLDRVEVYAHTGPLPSPGDYMRYGALIKSILVKQPPKPGAPGVSADSSADVSAVAPPGAKAEAAPTAKAAARSAKVDGAEIVEQGSVTSVSETLTDAHKELGPVPVVRTLSTVPVVEVVETPGTVNLPLPIVRNYVVVGVSRSRNRRGAFAGPVGVPLVEPPAAPSDVEASYTAEAISLAWAPGQGGYNVYEVPADWTGLSADSSAVAAPSAKAEARSAKAESRPVVPLNAALLTKPAFTDARVEFGTERCYIVRAVSMAGRVALESEAARPVCVKPVDTFGPAAPRGLASVSSEKEVSLVWEPNSENDLGGYLVLRGDAAGEKLSPLTPSPIRETTYRDASVQPGRSYLYEVVAVDTATPPNVSEPSNRVEEVIR
jgi:hypothetical protein